MKTSENGFVNMAINAYEWLDEVLKSIGIFAGGVATSLADWVFGAVTMTILLSNYTGFSPWLRWVAGGIFSLALWGIQIILWRIILTGKISKISKNNQTTLAMYTLVIIGIAIVKFGDDFSDIVGVYWLIRDNPMQAILTAGLYKTLLGTIFFLTWAICGFAEIFVALSINLLKDDNSQQGGGKQQGGGQGKHQQGQQQQFQGKNRDGGDRRQETIPVNRERRLEELRKKHPIPQSGQGQKVGEFHVVNRENHGNNGNNGNNRG